MLKVSKLYYRAVVFSAHSQFGIVKGREANLLLHVDSER